ncbi:MAG: formate--tetrahydrofolate ligase, partial [Acidobacteria bacterium]|nr:formate--tetrahydrofolate ligase [Acidobacteriota bacterium]
RPVTAGELRATGAMALLLKDALRPNLVQTLEGGPAFVHAGPFGNIAHGCNSVIATKSALALADIVVTEAGFGSDLGAEKFFDIKCRMAGLQPEAAVVVATVRSLKMHGGGDKKNLGAEDLGALERGLPNLEKHIENVRHFGVPSVVALNRRVSDSDAELQLVTEFASRLGVRVALTEVWEKGGAGGEALGTELIELLDKKGAEFRPLYPTDLPIKQKIDIIVKQIYGGDGADYTPEADRAIAYIESIGLGNTPVCMAKTQYSLTDDATKLGRPRGFRIQVNEVRPSAGAGFVVAQCGDIMTMPGLPKEPAAERMARLPSGEIVGLF